MSADSTTENTYTTGETEVLPVNLKTLLDAGAHYGHQTERWNPKMLPFIYSVKNNVHIINLDITLKAWEKASKFVHDVISRGGNILFVGTKAQARDLIRVEAEKCSGFFVTTRWLGGTLSNFQTIKNSIDRMRKYEDLLEQASQPDSKVNLHKKEKLTLSRELAKLNANLGGIRSMKRAPDVVFIVDINKEDIAVREARKLHIPVVALVDTNTDPTMIDFPIPSNDDSSRTIRLFTAAMAKIVLEAREQFEARLQKDRDSKDSDGTHNHNGNHSTSNVGGASALA